MTRKKLQRGATMVEFALVAGLFFLLVMILLDVGKAIYVKNTLDAAARDGARRAVILNNPNLKDIEDTVRQHSSDVFLAEPCPFNAPTAPTQANTGTVYVSKMPAGGPGGFTVPAGCTGTTAANHTTITVTITYKYQPITPFIGQFLGGGLTFTSSSTMTTEY
jgi:Flp pilus assembly protein TadG